MFMNNTLNTECAKLQQHEDIMKNLPQPNYCIYINNQYYFYNIL